MGLDCSSNGLQNGIGSRILGGLKLKSRESVLNLGEIISVKQPLNISTKKCIENYGTIVSDHNMTFETPEQLLNTGKISGKGIDLKKAYKVTNVETGITEGESVLFREGAHLYNTGRVAAENLKLSNIIFDQLDGNGGKKIDSAGILEARDTISIIGNKAEGILKARKFEFTSFSKGSFEVSDVLNLLKKIRYIIQIN